MEEIINQLIDLVLQMKYLIGAHYLISFALYGMLFLNEFEKRRKKKNDTGDN